MGQIFVVLFTSHMYIILHNISDHVRVVESCYGNGLLVLVLIAVISVPITLHLMHWYTLINGTVTEHSNRQIIYSNKG